MINNKQFTLSDLAFDSSGIRSIEYDSLPTESRCDGHDSTETNFQPEPVRQWLADCLQNHPTCSSESSIWSPKRLVYVGTKHAPELKLVVQEQDSVVQYATLSYRWPQTSHPLKLQPHNLEQFQKQIEFDPLSPTVRNAIEIAREIDIHYLWVDSLCIIQNEDDPDMLSEVQSMADVYCNSLLNISASSALDGTEPLIRHRCSQHDTHPLYRTDNGLKVMFSSSLQSEPMEGPLKTRGWTLQEDLLASRTIYVSNYGTNWRCQNSIRGVKPSFCVNTHEDLSSLIRQPVFLCHTWLHIVIQFTQRSLTVRSDIIPAIQGVADFLEKRYNMHYLTGLWEESLHVCLLWELLESHEMGPNRYNTELDLPTWSWASVQGEVHFRGADRSYVHIHDDGEVRTSFWSISPGGTSNEDCRSLISLESADFGPVGKGIRGARVLHIRGLLIPCEFNHLSKHSTGYWYAVDPSFSGNTFAPNGHIDLHLDCGEEIVESRSWPPIYFIPTAYNSTKVSGIVVTPGGRAFSSGMGGTDQHGYRRIGILYITKRIGTRGGFDLNESIPSMIVDWVQSLRVLSGRLPREVLVRLV